MGSVFFWVESDEEIFSIGLSERDESSGRDAYGLVPVKRAIDC